MPAGRPTDCTKEMIEKSRQYLDECVDSYEKVQKLGEIKEQAAKKVKGKGKGRGSNRKVEGYEWRLVVNLPSVAGLSRYLGVARSTVYDWSKNNDEFRDILEDILGEQEKRLVENSLANVYNSNISKLVLGKHGYKDARDLTSGDKPIAALLDDLEDDDEGAANRNV